MKRKRRSSTFKGMNGELGAAAEVASLKCSDERDFFNEKQWQRLAIKRFVAHGVPMTVPPRHTDRFDEQCDVVIVGLGLAGATAAIEAHDRGLEVVILEKMSVPGGISITAGGGFVLAHDPAKALAYLRATNDRRIADAVLTSFVEGIQELGDYVSGLAKLNNARLGRIEGIGSYPFPGGDAFSFLVVEDIPGFDPDKELPHVQGWGGRYTFTMFLNHVHARAIDVRLETPVVRLITSTSGEVVGVWAQGRAGALRAIRARSGVVLACGGFEAAPEMQREYWPIGSALSASFMGNEGDGIRMATDAGARLWHMWHFHGALGFRHPDPASYPLGIRTKSMPMWTEGLRETDAKMAWIIVDRRGRRFMNEYPPYFADTGHRGIEFVDESGTRPRIPCYMIVDDVGRQLYRLGEPYSNDPDIKPYAWAGEHRRDWPEANLDQVRAGLLKSFDTIEEMAEHIGCEGDVLRHTLERWNEACDNGRDDEFGRPSKSMVPVRTAPFILGELWPLCSNTQGGPAHDECQRVLDVFGQPISRLYEAGECGGIWGYLYLGAGNYSECVVGGRIAARELAKMPRLPEWKETVSNPQAAG